MSSEYIFFILAAISSLTMGLFYIMDMFFESRGVYKRPSQAMIISSIVPLLSVPFFVATPWWHNLPTTMWFVAFGAGACLIWANWFYFLVMFPVDKENREVKAIEGATELALYEGTTPAIILVLSFVASQFIVYTDHISGWQGIAVVITVTGLVLFALADGFVGFTRWSYRLKLIAFALLAAVSQIIQDFAVNYMQQNYNMTLTEAYVSVSPIVWVGMFSGIMIVLWKQEWNYFKLQWKAKIKQYSWIILIAEVIALGSYASLLASYTGTHVAVASSIAASFPIIVFFGGIILQKLNFKEGDELASTSHLLRKAVFIALTLVGVIGVIMW